MNTEIKTQDNEGVDGKYSFQKTVKETEKTILTACKAMKTSPPATAIIADEVGIGFTLIPQVDGMSNNEVMTKLGTAMAHGGKKVKAVGVVCEAYVSKRTDIAPSKDPKAKEVVFMAFEDETGAKEMRVYTGAKGKLKRMKGMDNGNFTGLVDSFWTGYKTPQVNASVTPTMC